jgi:predicted dinucleotide-utilizing enzyme
MTIEELIKKLQDIIEVDPELAKAEVHMATQPHYPLVTKLSHIKTISTNGDDIEEAQKELDVVLDQRSRDELEAYIAEQIETNVHTIVMVEGDWVGYGSRKLWNDED